MLPGSKSGQPVGDWLQKNIDAYALLDRAGQISVLNQALHQWCADYWVGQIRIANLRSGVLVVYASSAAALVSLRSRQTELMSFLNTRFAIRCRNVEAKVVPVPGPKRPTV